MEVGTFELKKTNGLARRGAFMTAHGLVQTPVFMNVGTQGAIKGALSAEDLQRIQGGDYAAYQMPEEMAKDLHLTHEHLYWTPPEISSLKETRQVSPVNLDSMDVLYGKEIFVHRSIMESMPQLAQALGCLGAYANIEMSDDIDFILIPKDMPAEICDAVEDYYNSSRSTMFNVPFVILEDLLSYLQERIQRFPDEVLSQLINIL